MIIRGGTVVTVRGVEKADIEIAGDQIAAVGQNLPDDGEEIDASGIHIFPGGVDSHVHLNEPGRTAWEDIAHGSAALAAGGYTSFIDMPLNNLPVTTDVEAFDLKLDAMKRSSIVDFGLWGGLVPGNLDQLEPLVKRGVMGFKAFMCPSGIEEFPASDFDTLLYGMRRIQELDSILLVHAESSMLTEMLSTQAVAAGRHSARDFIASRPDGAELEAISLVCALAVDTHCRVHVVHVSTGEGAQWLADSEGHGVDVSGETCPHYLLYTESDLERLGGLGKCAPPFRTARDRDDLWQRLAEGSLKIVVSDHSPSTLDLKQGDDFFKLWGGISGCQSTRQLLLAHAAERGVDLPTVAAVTATNVARRFGLAQKGDVAAGFDADLWLVDLSQEGIVRREDLLYRNPFSAHEGQPIRGRTVRTLVRGKTVFADGKPATTRPGRFLRPLRGEAPPR
ncbi:MAG TPA: allantoinase AllB [Candidatus Dormibacteraeota bacterium]|nr:allantoinase AllB [Candidatus Dormibacteraeota bacterium]